MFHFKACFRCNSCGHLSTRIVKTALRSKFDACEKIGRVFCHNCIAGDALEFLSVEELDLKHLEEFICWVSF